MKNKHFGKRKLLHVVILSLFILPILTSAAFAVDVTAKSFNKKDGLQSQICLKIFNDEDAIWFAAGRAGASKYDKQTETFKAYTKDHKVVIAEITDIVSAFGKMWFGNERALVSMDENGAIETFLKIDAPVAGGTTKGGNKKSMLHKPLRMWNLDGYLWVCAYGANGGLFRFDGSYWEEIRYNKSVFNYVNNMAILGDDIWYSTQGFGILIYNKPTGEWTSIAETSNPPSNLPSSAINDMILVGNTIYAATNKGICKVEKDGDTITVTSYDEKNTDGLMKNTLSQALTATESGDVFAAMLGNVFKYSAGSWEAVNIKTAAGKNLPIIGISDIQNDGDTIWLGTNRGILRLD